jgi:hypothetical protein
MSSNQREIRDYHALSYNLFPKKHIHIDEYNRLQALLLDESYIQAIADMNLYESPSYYKKEYMNSIKENYGVHYKSLSQLYKHVYDKKMFVDWKIQFEPGANWSACITVRDSEKQFNISPSEQLESALYALGVNDKHRLTTNHTVISYDDIRGEYWGYIDLYGVNNGKPEPTNIYIDIVPTLDDYSSVLKRLNAQIELTNEHRPGKNNYILLTDRFESRNTTFQTVETIFEKSGIALIRLSELDQFLERTD